jgi:hypothetical protein
MCFMSTPVKWPSGIRISFSTMFRRALPSGASSAVPYAGLAAWTVAVCPELSVRRTSKFCTAARGLVSAAGSFGPDGGLRESK